MSVEQTEAVVVGASASGLLTAIHLAEAGMPVRVIEQGEATNTADRTLIVTHHLRKFLPTQCQGCIVGEVGGFELYANGLVSSITLNEPDLVIERSRLIADLANHARSLGVDVVENAKCVGLRRRQDGFAVSIGNGGRVSEITTTFLVGADGSFSAVAKGAGLSPLPTVPLVQAIVETPEDLSPETSRIWFRPDDTSFFYWLVQHRDGRSVVGLIGDPGSAPRRKLDRFLVERRLVPIEYQSARIPSSTRRSHVGRRREGAGLYLVGDAAGHVKISTVGGVVSGFAGAAATARAILGTGGRRALRSLESELALHRLVRRVIKSFDVEDYCRLLDSLNAEAISLLGEVSRDELGLLLRRLIVRRPQLLAIALRTMSRRNVKQVADVRPTLDAGSGWPSDPAEVKAPSAEPLLGTADSGVDR